MQCLFCGNNTAVTNSRKSRHNSIWRRRQCNNCGRLFSTSEQADLESILLVNRGDNKNQPYNRATLELSILKACDHLVGRQQLHVVALCSTIETELLRRSKDRQVSIVTMTQTVSEVLKRLDNLAYIKYCASHELEPS